MPTASPAAPPRSVAVVGAGAAGLAAAFELHRGGARVTVFEAAARPGGVIRTISGGGFTADLGPNTLTPTPASERLTAALGLDTQEAASPARVRYVAHRGRLVALPTTPAALLGSPLFSMRGKLRLLSEPLVRARAEREDETFAEFVRRRMGDEALERAAGPFVAGVFAGDPEHLSARHAFPRLVELEERHGSVVRGAIREMRTARKEGRPRPRPTSFAGGLTRLTDALAAALPQERVLVGTPVAALHRTETGWQVELEHPRNGLAAADLRFDAVVVAVPAHRIPFILPDLDAEARDALTDIAHPPVAVLALGFRRADVTHPLDGFGFLVPESEPYDVLGALFSSTLFPDRAPEDHVLLTVFIGGMRNPELALATEPPERQLEAALRALVPLVGVRGAPAWEARAAWPLAIPQYAPGYERVVEALDRTEAAHPGLILAGSFRQGVALGEALASGVRAAERVLGGS